MVELIIAVYGGICWLLFKKLKLIPVTTYTVCTAILGGIVILGMLGILLIRYQPASADGRLYAYTTPIVPNVKGTVIDVPIENNQPLRKDDVLFRIDTASFQFEVDRLDALLADAMSGVGQLGERVQAADAAVRQAQSVLRNAGTAFELAQKTYVRFAELVEKGSISRQQFDRAEQDYRSADEKLGEARAAIAQAEAQRREAELAFSSDSGGMNPKVREIRAQLDQARWALDQTVVRAPADGFVTQLALRPGQMATSFPFAPTMVFVHAERKELIATFPQNVIAVLEPGQQAELAFKAYPGEIFLAEVVSLQEVAAEGQLSASGLLRNATAASAPGRIAVRLKYGEDVAELDLPGGSQAMVAIYTEHFHVLSILRKIILRMKGWENYLFMP